MNRLTTTLAATVATGFLAVVAMIPAAATASTIPTTDTTGAKARCTYAVVAKYPFYRDGTSIKTVVYAQSACDTLSAVAKAEVVTKLKAFVTAVNN